MGTISEGASTPQSTTRPTNRGAIIRDAPSTFREWAPMPKAVGMVAVAYITVDYLRVLRPALHARLQPLLWGILAVALASRTPSYPHWKLELKSVGVFLLTLLFMLGAFVVEAISVQFVTTVLGLDWHWAAAPLPDTGQWLLLHLNERLPTWVVNILRSPVVGLHHFLILFLMLPFSVLYDCVKAPGMGLGARYMFTMAIGRLLRVITFVPTIVPSARPWCAHSRFRTATHPHPWAQKYYTPYASNPEMVRNLLKRDELFATKNDPSQTPLHQTCLYAPAGEYPAEYVPRWGSMQFLVDILRPPNPEVYPEFQGRSWFSILKRAGGGCNDLIFSGHILVSVLTAMAWTEAYPGWTAGWIWLLVLHSAQREIRERHHYSVDVVSGIYMGVLLWWLTGFLWSKQDRWKVTKSKLFAKKEDTFIKAAKDGDMEKIREILSEIEGTRQETSYLKLTEWIGAVSLLTSLFCLVLLAFTWTENG